MSVIERELVSQHADSEEDDLMTPEDQIRTAVNAQAKIVSELKMLDRKFKRVQGKSLNDLLDIDIDPQITSVTSLMQRHTELFQAIVELEPAEDVLTTATTSAEEVQDTYTDLLAGYKCLSRLREAYDSVLQAECYRRPPCTSQPDSVSRARCYIQAERKPCQYQKGSQFNKPPNLEGCSKGITS